jgi:hypothetical protein
MSEGTSVSDDTRLDGNAAAGLLSEMFACDITTARATCVDCGSTDSVGAMHLYSHGMGAVLRCPGCECVVLRVARTPTHLWLDATGSRSIAIPMHS